LARRKATGGRDLAPADEPNPSRDPSPSSPLDADTTVAPQPVGSGAPVDRDGRYARAAALIAADAPADAEAIFRDLLAEHPTDKEVLHSLGLLCLATNRMEEAATLLAGAEAQDPASAAIAATLGQALLHLRRDTEALASLDRAIALEPAFAEARLNRGVALSRLARHVEALAEIDQALVWAPLHAEASNMRGVVLMALGRLPEALTSFARAVALRAGFTDALFNHGTTLYTLGHDADAVASFDRLLALCPDHTDGLLNRGNALLGVGRVADGLADYRAMQALLPDHPEININIGTALQRLDRHAEALASFYAAVALAPDHPAAHNNRGNALVALDRPDEALAAYEQALVLDPRHAESHYNRANLLQMLDRLQEALAGYDRALALRPDFAEARINRGAALQRFGHHTAALDDFARAQALRPDNADAHWNESLSHLALGDYAEGWRKYEWRWKTADLRPFRRDFAAPLWLGQADLAGRTLLIHAEQGFGDTLQFCRYLKLLPSEARILFEVPRPLLRLMATLSPAVTLIAQGDALPAFDWHCPLLSLPLAFGTMLETIPRDIPYLSADPALADRWRRRLTRLPGLWAGVCWAGNSRRHQPSASAVDRRRSTRLASWAPLGTVSGISLVSLQKDQSPEQIAELPGGMMIRDWTNELHDFADTAALIAALDLVITVDTAVAHLAGALGKPVWSLHRHDACWRWLTGRRDSTWYPTATLFRQSRAGDWDAVFAEVAGALHDVMAIPPRRMLIMH
jgi:tetratricopeptide (TPR) repeat protein